MTTILPVPSYNHNATDPDQALEADFKPLNAQQAREWRKNHNAPSIWKIVLAQLVVGVLLVLLAWVWSGQRNLAWSTAYGALAVVMPSAVFARGLSRQQGVATPGAALLGLMVWELAKLGLTLVMLVMAPVVVAQLNWLALLVGFVVTMKVYWLALMLSRHRASV